MAEFSNESGDPIRSPRRYGLIDWIEAFFLVVAAGIVIWSLHPGLLFSSSTITGGDTGAHVGLAGYQLGRGWAFSLTPWYPGWFAGMPAYTYYFVLPDLLAVYGAHIFGFAVSFKLATILGSVILPGCVYGFARLIGARRPIPLAMGLASLGFLFDASFTILGGNLFSTMAGEYSFSLGLGLALLTIGFFWRGIRRARGYWISALLLSLTLGAHVLPWFFAIAAVGLIVIGASVKALFTKQYKGVRLKRLGRVWGFAGGAGVLSGVLSAWWLVPFVSTQNMTNSMGYTNDNTHSWSVVGVSIGWLNSSGGAGGDRTIIILAGLGALWGVIRRSKVGLFLFGLVVISLGAYLIDPQSVIWDERLLPFWFIGVYMLGGYLIGDILSLVVWGKEADKTRKTRLAKSVWLGWLGIRKIDEELAKDGSGGLALAHEQAEVDSGAEVVSRVGTYWPEESAHEPEESAHEVPEAQKSGTDPGEILGPPVGERLSLGSAPRKMAVGTRLVVVSLLVGVLGIGSVLGDLNGQVAGWLGLNTSGNQVSNWAAWNYSGYQSKPGWGEYHNIMVTMSQVARRYGCGRAMWEYNSDQNRFGTPEALMLLPYWTHNCVGSMEGLLFESSATTPYHFLDQAELSTGPSDPQVGLDYGGVDVNLGIEHLQMLGVKYFLAYTPAIVAQARKNSSLVLVAKTKIWGVGGYQWFIFRVLDSPLVTGMASLPNVVSSVSSRVGWLAANEKWWLNPAYWASPIAAAGPKSWPRVSSLAKMKLVGTAYTRVSAVSYANGVLKFRVNKVGSPILIKISYFPGWIAHGASGPYRVSPNLMVVVPTAKRVELVYAATPLGSWANRVSLIGWMSMIGWVLFRALRRIKNRLARS